MKYAFYACSSLRFPNKGYARHYSHLRKCKFPVAPLEEQRRIVSKIDELFSQIEDGERALEKVRKLVERYRQSVLKAAVTGELTREWREQHAGELESGEDLLTRILEARRKAWETAELPKLTAKMQRPNNDFWKRRYKDPPPPEKPESVEIPDSWVWATLDQMGAPTTGAVTDGPFGSNLKTSSYTKEGPRVIRLQNIKDGYFADVKAHISDALFLRLQRHSVEAGDLLIAALGEVLPKSCVCPEGLGRTIVKADCIRARMHPDVSAPCIASFLNSSPVRKRTLSTIHGVGRPRLNLDEIRSLVLPLPPMQEQQVIAERLAIAFQEALRIETEVNAALQSKIALKRSTLQKAFTGQLVSQERSDERASFLLERIAGQRAAAESDASAAREQKSKRRFPSGVVNKRATRTFTARKG